ncbi:uncharacterized protein LOC118006178 [Mirounga leonina]|uniref:uncharacterized protein LOC118006178 n=1 Tax=Mirounga leonina TaxID=9715 RepID=UPI00156BFCF4|nr:uncharacterized protein LOC118006178 [Mirounga leonina]
MSGPACPLPAAGRPRSALPGNRGRATPGWAPLPPSRSFSSAQRPPSRASGALSGCVLGAPAARRQRRGSRWEMPPGSARPDLLTASTQRSSVTHRPPVRGPAPDRAPPGRRPWRRVLEPRRRRPRGAYSPLVEGKRPPNEGPERRAVGTRWEHTGVYQVSIHTWPYKDMQIVSWSPRNSPSSRMVTPCSQDSCPLPHLHAPTEDPMSRNIPF